jgi:hypothetical protein
MDDFFRADNWFRRSYHGEPGDRFWTFKCALDLFLERGHPYIVETGCQREVDDYGAGGSTVKFARTCHKYGKILYTVDNNKKHLKRAKKFTEKWRRSIRYINANSVELLEQFGEKIGLLYLDSVDHPMPPGIREAFTLKDFDPVMTNVIACQQHCLREIQAAYDKLDEKSVVLFDDYDFPTGGKSKLAKEWLEERGWIKVLESQQLLMIAK